MAPIAAALTRLRAAAAAATLATTHHLPRQHLNTRAEELVTIPSHYGSLNSGPAPGTVAGIVLGSVAGFILLLWLLYTCINMGNPNASSGNETSTVVTEGTGSMYTRRRPRHASRRRTGEKETIEIRRHRSGVIVDEEGLSSVGGGGTSTILSEVDPGRVIIEERRRRSVSRPRYSQPPPPRRVVDSSGEEEDEVVVIEEHSPRPKRHRSRVRSVERRSSGFREVDPDRFAGGEAPFVEVRRSSSRR